MANTGFQGAERGADSLSDLTAPRSARHSEITSPDGFRDVVGYETCGMPVVELTRFIGSRQRIEALVVARAKMVKELSDRPCGFRGAYLIHVSDQEWIDLTVWETEADADAAIIHQAATSGFFGLVDGILGQERGTLVDGSCLDRAGL